MTSQHVTIERATARHLVIDFIQAARRNDITGLHVADRALAQELGTLQSRSGKIRGRSILAFGCDGLGNVVALTTDRVVLSF
jgi:hypothetical protein